MNKQFEKGREYERFNRDIFFHLFFGYGCLVGGIMFFIPKVLFKDFVNISVSITLILIGIVSLYLGYSEKKELKKLK